MISPKFQELLKPILCVPSTEIRRRRYGVDESLHQKIADLRRSGMKLHDIAITLNCRPSDVGYAIKLHGLSGFKGTYVCENCNESFVGAFKRPLCLKCDRTNYIARGPSHPKNPHIEEMVAMRASGCTLSVIGSKFGISKERVRQLITNSPQYRLKKSCVICQKEFVASWANSETCSVACRRFTYMDPCPRCGTLKAKKSSHCQPCFSFVGQKISADRLRELRESGMPMTEIAKELGVGYHSLFTRCQQFGIKNPNPRSRTNANFDLVTKEMISDRVEIDHVTGCWNWTHHRNKTGYAVVSYRQNGKHRISLAHRVSYWVFKGKYDRNLCVCHKCDNPKCVNPEHLFLGTQKDNNHDCIRKGRKAWQKKQHCA